MTFRAVLHPQKHNVVVIETDNATDDLANEINDWVKEHNLGIRIAFLMWKLRNEKDVTVFLLRWTQ